RQFDEKKWIGRVAANGCCQPHHIRVRFGAQLNTLCTFCATPGDGMDSKSRQERCGNQGAIDALFGFHRQSIDRLDGDGQIEIALETVDENGSWVWRNLERFLFDTQVLEDHWANRRWWMADSTSNSLFAFCYEKLFTAASTSG